MISLNYPSSYATATNALSVPPTVLTSRNGDTLPRTFIKEPSAVELVEAFKTTTDSNALVINKLHSLTYDAVATLQSLRDSNITHHLTAFEEILRSYAIVRYLRFSFKSRVSNLAPCHTSSFCSSSERHAMPLARMVVSNLHLLKALP